MRLGQLVYWVEVDRPIQGPATVRVKEGKFFRAENSSLCVCDVYGEPRGATVVEARVWFDTQSDAESYAIGTAVRLVQAFHYTRADVIGVTGKSLFAYTLGELTDATSAR